MDVESAVLSRTRSRLVALVVDDDAGMRKLVKDLLAWEGIDTRELPGGEGLSEAVGGEEVSLVVLDKEMPGSCGLDLVAYLSRRCPEVPLIVITAFGGPTVRAEALARGATIYLDKPFRVGDFLRAVRQALCLKPPGRAAPNGSRWI
jgi:DNA-binding NtrC family response regulator